MLVPVAAVELVWQDETGSTSVTTLFAPSSATLADIDAAAMAVASIFAPLTGCVLMKTRIKYKSVPSSPVVAGGSTPITRTGMFFFTTGGDNPDSLVSVPSLKDSVILTTEPFAGIGIDLSNSDVLSFRDAVLSLPFSNPFGDEFVTLIAAYLQSRV